MGKKFSTFINKLRSSGYTVKDIGNGRRFALHGQIPFLYIYDNGYGCIFYSCLEINDEGKENTDNLFEYVNSLNSRANVCRFFLDDDLNLCREAWHPNIYEEFAFDMFIKDLDTDIDLIYSDDKIAAHVYHSGCELLPDDTRDDVCIDCRLEELRNELANEPIYRQIIRQTKFTLHRFFESL